MPAKSTRKNVCYTLSMKNLPFFANTPDNTRCVQAAFRIILKYFMPERNFSYAQLDQMSQKMPGKDTWWPPMLIKLQKMGFSVKSIEAFDYRRFYEEGETYVRGIYPEATADYHLNQTNLKEIKPLIPEFLSKIATATRPGQH